MRALNDEGPLAIAHQGTFAPHDRFAPVSTGYER